MKVKVLRAIAPLLAVTVLLVAATRDGPVEAHNTMISEFGKYRGYSEPIYNGTQRTSDYLTLSDGTQLAYDVIIPTRKGTPADTPLPALFSYTPYGRTWTIFDRDGNFLVGGFVDLPTKVMARLRYWIMGEKGRIMDPLWRHGWLKPVVKHGYVVVAVDRPGTGASFSSPTPGSMETAARFENEIIDWIVSQPWSDGNVAMYGESQLAMVQFAAAATGNPHLKAILPASSDIELYEAVMYPGGIYNQAFAALYGDTVPLLGKLATPVDGDPDGALLVQAVQQRNSETGPSNAAEMAKLFPFRDSTSADGVNYWDVMDLYPFIDRINQSSTAVYMTVGWYDIFTADILYWYNNLSVPRRLTVRPTDHSQVDAKLADLDYGVEALRWLDFWLKGIDNGIMDEAPIHYYVQDGPRKGTWQASDRWPLASQELTPYYFGPGKSGTVASANDGGLGQDPPVVASGSDAYTVDYSTTTGTKSRWGAVEETHNYPELSAHDAKALTYTTLPLESDVEVTGHPVVHLWLTTEAPDLDVFAYLEAVDQRGNSVYVTEGSLRASHRKLSQAPFNNLGLPYHSHYQSDREPVPALESIELLFSLLPTSYRFHSGSRIRITIAFADAGNFDTPILTPAPTLELLRDAGHSSSVELPIAHWR